MKKICVIIMLYFAIAAVSYGAVPYYLKNNVNNYIPNNLNAASQPLKFVVPGKVNSDGTVQAEVIHQILQVDPKDYFQGQIHIKTRLHNTFISNQKTFSTPSLMSVISKYNIQSIRPLFESSNTNSTNRTLSSNWGVEDDISRIYEIHYSASIDPYDLCRELMNNPDIEYATPIFKRYTYDYTPNDPSLSNQWAVNTIQLKKAWDITKGDKTVKIGIVDSGVFWTHEDLQNNIWTNPGETGTDSQGRDKKTNGIDDDGDGYIDDWHGWDFIGDLTTSQLANGQWKEDNNPTNTIEFHGTHVAGIVSAVTDNNTGIAGTAFNCTLLPVKCGIDNPPSQAYEGVFRGYDGIKYAADRGADIINCSWGGPGSSPAEQDVINYAIGKGSVVVVAAGNDNGLNVDDGHSFPAGYDNVLCVGSTGSADKISSFSNLGIKVTVYAPGENIYSTLPNNSYGNEDGTSMASPMVAGVAALVKSVHKNWTPKQIIHQIRSTADNVVNTNTNQRPFYYGRVNAYKAVNFNNNSGSNVPGLEVTSVNFNSGGAITDTVPTPVTLKVMNYLANASNVTISVLSMDNTIKITPQQSNVGDIAMMQEIPVNIVLQTLPSNPWFTGNAKLLVTFTSGAYTDYQLIQIPIQLKTNNTYKSLLNMGGYATQWLGASSPNENSLWGVGFGGMFNNQVTYMGGYIHTNSAGNYNVINLTSEMCSNVFALDDNNVYIVTGNTTSSIAYIYKTTNGGTNWNNTNVSTNTPFINDIFFYDASNGIYLGDPKGTRWGIASSSDGGKNWNNITDFPPAVLGETGLNTSCAFLGNNVWFGTTNGRVYRSTNRGAHWDQAVISGAASVMYVSFMDSLNGVAVYNQSQGGPLIAASSADGGKNWTANKYNFNTNALIPITLYTAPGSGLIFALCSRGEVYASSDNGSTWFPELSMLNATTYMGAGFTNSNQSKVRMWNIGDNLGYLDFFFKPATITKELTLLSGSVVQYDTIAVNSSQIQNVVVQNTGNVDINISTSIMPGNGTDITDFKFFGIPPATVLAGQQVTMRVRFNPTTQGLKIGTLVIQNDASLPEIDVSLIGFASKPASVQDNTINDNCILNQNNPNPCSDYTTISYYLPNSENIELSLINSLGITVQDIFNGNSNPGWNNININLQDLAEGVYFIRLKTNNSFIYKKMIIIR